MQNVVVYLIYEGHKWNYPLLLLLLHASRGAKCLQGGWHFKKCFENVSRKYDTSIKVSAFASHHNIRVSQMTAAHKTYKCRQKYVTDHNYLSFYVRWSNSAFYVFEYYTTLRARICTILSDKSASTAYYCSIWTLVRVAHWSARMF